MQSSKAVAALLGPLAWPGPGLVPCCLDSDWEGGGLGLGEWGAPIMGRDWDGRRRGDVDKSLSIQIHLSLDSLVSSSRMMGTGAQSWTFV